MKVLRAIINGIAVFVENLSMWPSFVAILGMVLMVFISVFSRLFGYPLQPVEEYTGYFAAIITMFSLAYILKRASHVAVDYIPQRLSRKPRIILETTTLSISLVIVILFLIAGTRLTIESFVTKRLAWTIMETPLGYVQMIIPIGLILFIFQIVYELVNDIRALFGSREEGKIEEASL
jgi:TRAP-type C4-dicarboxylate transport system permease small subunit